MITKDKNIKTNRVLGARGISVVNANLNAGFDGRPKELPDGTWFNSDVSTKFLDREFWAKKGENVLIKKISKTTDKDEIYVCTLAEVIDEKVDSSKCFPSQVLNDFVDVQNYGVAITVKNKVISAPGVVQYLQGINKIEDANTVTQDVLSPFGTGKPSKKSSKSSTTDSDDDSKSSGTSIGKHTFIDRGCFVQSFSVNPSNFNYLVQQLNLKDFNGYKESSYESFKQAVTLSASLYNTRAKAGCYDEFSIFINLKEDSLFALNDVGSFINVEVLDDGKLEIDFSELDFINSRDDVESIEIFHNTKTSTIKHSFTNVTVRNILEL